MSMNKFFNLSQGESFPVQNLPTNLLVSYYGTAHSVPPNMTAMPPSTMYINGYSADVHPVGRVDERYVNNNGVDVVVLRFEVVHKYTVPAQHDVMVRKAYITNERISPFVKPYEELFVNRQCLLKDLTYDNYVYPKNTPCIVTGYNTTLMGKVEAHMQNTFLGELKHYTINLPPVTNKVAVIYKAVITRGG